MTNREIADVFANMAIFLSMDGEPFRARAHEKGAESINNSDVAMSEIYTRGGTKALKDEVEGVGQGLADHIEELLKTGKSKEYDTYKKKFPMDIKQLSRVEGLGAKSILTLYTELGIKNVVDLENAAKEGKIRDISGFGEKKEQAILKSLAFVKENSSRALLGDILPFAQHLSARLAAVPGVKKVDIAGSLRRMKETVGDVDLVAISSKPESLMKYFVSMPEVVQVQEHGTTRSIVHLSNGLDCDLRVVPSESYGAALLYFSGSKEHQIELRRLANEKGMTLNEYGLYKENDKGEKGELVASKTEKEIYSALGLSYIEPELREMTGEIEAAQKKTLPSLISYKSLHGDFQTQTDWSDGANSIEDMAMAAQRAGLSYITITDHTQSLSVTNGLDENRLEKQSRLIDRLNEKFHGITILKGAEVNILKDGTLDISDAALAKLDMVGVSVHSHFNLSKEEQTKRVLRALAHPSVNIFFHPTGRRLNKREAYDIDMDEVLKAAKKYNVVMEINASPSRLDLKDSYIRKALEYGVLMAIDSDAHAVEHFAFLPYGIGQARRGWVQEENILNTRTLKEVKKVFNKKR